MDRWKDIFWKNIYTYMNIIIQQYIKKAEYKNIYVNDAINKFNYSGKVKIKRKEYKKEGIIPIVDQGQKFIGGYTNNQDAQLNIEEPVIIFGDHTKNKKYIDFSFAMGADGIKILKPKKNLHSKFFYYSLFALSLKDKGYSRHYKLLKNQLIYLPYFNTLEKSYYLQKSISEFLDDLEKNRIDGEKEYFNKEIENKITKLQRRCIKADELNTQITKQRTYLQKLRQQILQEAVQGKLTEEWRRQHPDVEPASELLKRIKTEKKKLVKEGKIKKSKPLPPVKEEEKPFELPEGWVWCRLGEIKKEMTNGIYKPANYYDKSGIGCLRMYNIQGGKIVKNNLKRMILTDKELETYKLEENDILINRVNSIELLGKAALIQNNEEPLVFESKNIRLRLIGNLNPEYINIVFLTTLIKDQILRNFKKVTGQASINQTQLTNFVIPLPSQAEQKEIANKINGLFDKCEQLQKQTDKNSLYADKLMQTVLREAFEG